MASLQRGKSRIALIAAWFLFAGFTPAIGQRIPYGYQSNSNEIVSMARTKIYVNIPGFQWDDFDFSVNNGTVTKKPDYCLVRPKMNTDTLVLTILVNNRVLGHRYLKVKSIFDMLEAKINYRDIIYLDLKNGKSPPRGFRIEKMHCTVVRKGYAIRNYFTPDKFYKKGAPFIRGSLRKGDVVYYTNIQVSIPGYDANYSLDPVKITK